MSLEPNLKGDIVEWRRKEEEKWSFERLAGLRVRERCPVNHQWDNQTWPAAATPSSSPHISCLSPCCAPPRLHYLFSSLLFSFGFVLFCTPLICFLLLCCAPSHTALSCSVVLSSIKQREHVIVLTALWVQLSPRRFLSTPPSGTEYKAKRYR